MDIRHPATVRQGENSMLSVSEKAAQNLLRIREKRPLIHSITNFVTINFTANTLLAMGASPVMAHAGSEVEEMAVIADALVLNIGTLSEDRIGSMIRAGKKYNDLGKPVIFDPVGAGASTYRTYSARKILREIQIHLVRGNASEILSLQKAVADSKGVDAAHTVEAAVETAGRLAEEFHAAVAVTGPVDMITDGNRSIRILNGHPIMGRVTGFGCAATAAAGAFAAVDPDSFDAAAGALCFLGLAGEVAGEKASGPGSFAVEFLDALYNVTPEDLKNRSRVEIL